MKLSNCHIYIITQMWTVAALWLLWRQLFGTYWCCCCCPQRRRRSLPSTREGSGWRTSRWRSERNQLWTNYYIFFWFESFFFSFFSWNPVAGALESEEMYGRLVFKCVCIFCFWEETLCCDYFLFFAAQQKCVQSLASWRGAASVRPLLWSR